MSTPHVCPKCHGENSTDCQPCKGTGIVWEAQPVPGQVATPEKVAERCSCGRCKECGRYPDPWPWPWFPPPIWIEPIQRIPLGPDEVIITSGGTDLSTTWRAD